MRLSSDEFRQWKNKSITLLGMSGVGKTFISNILRANDWFHYSGDYRIGTRYMNEPILDNVKAQAMQVPFLQDLLRSDSIYINSNITFDHLKPLSMFLSKLGDPAKGGLTLQEFKYRLKLHHQAEVAAMLDVPEFMRKSREIYGFNHFINDAGGSVCELDDQNVLDTMSEHTVMIYIEATEKDEKMLIERAVSSPKPLYYREAFLDEQLVIYMEERSLEYVALIEPDDFVRWVFPRLFNARIPRYKAIADKYAYTIKTTELYQVTSEQDFMGLIEKAIDRHV
ncbi:ATPase [Leucothrix sargassi]|nr:ATPase [Leucothrix sargassi]